MPIVDPFAPGSLEDPYPLYEALRRDRPVFRLPETGIWLVTRHADVVEAAGNPEVFSSHLSAIVYAGEGAAAMVLEADPDAMGAVDVLATQDPPAHTRQRKLMNRSFVHARIAALEPRIAAFVDAALDRARDGGRMEWVTEVANPLPASVIAEMLGLPREDLRALKRWSDAGIDLLSGVASAARMAECAGEMIGFLAYLRDRLASPSAGSVTADVAAAARRGELDESEAASLLLQLVIAGSESTSSLIGSAVRLLAEDRGLQHALRGDLARVPAFLEEVVRLESPFRGHFRVTRRTTEVGGTSLPAGARVMLMWGAANRDDAAFAAPERLDLDRAQPKVHVGFGSGIHFCIGAPLARLEARVAVETLLRRTSSFGPATGTRPTHVPSLFVRRLTALPLELRPESREESR